MPAAIKRGGGGVCVFFFVFVKRLITYTGKMVQTFT